MNCAGCEEHSPRFQYKCEFDGCDKYFCKPFKLQEHERIHTGERPFVCPVQGCNKQYGRSAHLKRHHAQAHHIAATSESSLLKCEYAGCSQTFVSKYNLKKHIARVHSSGGQYLCSFEGCGKRFAKRCQLRSHLFEHQGVLPFQCHFDNCLKKFKQSSHLKRHLKSHNDYKCNVDGCQQIFSKWSLLRKHNASQHRKVHSCNICQKSFAKNCLLGRHMRVAHSAVAEDDDVAEDICPRVSTSTNNDVAVVFCCPYDGCDRVYIDNRNLKAHVASHHCGQSFTCTETSCAKSFSTQQKLRLHMKKAHEDSSTMAHIVKKPRLNLHRKKSFVKRLTELAEQQQSVSEQQQSTSEQQQSVCAPNVDGLPEIEQCVLVPDTNCFKALVEQQPVENCSMEVVEQQPFANCSRGLVEPQPVEFVQ